MRAVLLVLRIALGSIFLYAAYTKLRQPWLLFAMSIDSYQLLPQWAVLTLGRVLPWVELLLGAVLVTGFGLRYAAAVATCMLAVFFAVMLNAYLRGMGIDCGCFGLGEKITALTLSRDGGLLALSLLTTVLAMRRNRRVAGPIELSPAASS